MLDKFGTRLIGKVCTIKLESETCARAVHQWRKQSQFQGFELSDPALNWFRSWKRQDIYMKHFESEKYHTNYCATISILAVVLRIRSRSRRRDFAMQRNLLQPRFLPCRTYGWNSSDFKSPARLRSEHSLRRKGYLFPAILLLCFFSWF